MKRREFYDLVKAEVSAAISTLANLDDESTKIKNKINSGKYSKTGLTELYNALDANKQEATFRKDMADKTIRGFVRDMTSSLADEVSLRGSDIHEDAKLLDFDLSAGEYVSLLNRHKGNPTMTQLILKSAKRAKIDLGIRFAGNADEIRAAEAVAFAAAVAIRNFRSKHVFDRLFGEDSPGQLAFDVDEKFPRPVETIAFSDDRVANAHAIVTRRGVEEDVQRATMREFAEQPGILKMLKAAAEEVGNLSAAYEADAIEQEAGY